MENVSTVKMMATAQFTETKSVEVMESAFKVEDKLDKSHKSNKSDKLDKLDKLDKSDKEHLY